MPAPAPAERPFDLLRRALALSFNKHPNSPHIADIARALRDGAHPLEDLIQGGEGRVLFEMQNGRLVIVADTDKYKDVSWRVL